MKHSTAIEEFITMKFLKYNIKYGVSISIIFLCQLDDFDILICVNVLRAERSQKDELVLATHPREVENVLYSDLPID